MPKDNEVDEKVTKGVVATVCLVPHLSDHFAGVELQLFGSYEPRIGDEFYSAATVAELRAEVERRKDALAAMSQFAKVAEQRADAAERRVGELVAAASKIKFTKMGEAFVASAEDIADLVIALTGADPT
jgi:hypothetical protein